MPENCLQIGVLFGTQTEIVASLNRRGFDYPGRTLANTPEIYSAGSPNEDRPGQMARCRPRMCRVQSMSPVEKMIDAERVTCRKEVVGRSMSQAETKMEVDLLSRSNAPGSADVKYLA